MKRTSRYGWINEVKNALTVDERVERLQNSCEWHFTDGGSLFDDLQRDIDRLISTGKAVKL